VHPIVPHGFIEIEWSHGTVVDTTTHFGTGR
jgi:hypothetical protein